MSHNALSRSMSSIPMWVVQAVLGLCLTGGVAWVTWASTSSWKHEVRITAIEGTVKADKEQEQMQMEDMKGDLNELKDGQKSMNQKLDRLIERRHP